MSSTVTDPRHRFGDAKVKNVSGLVERPRRGWLRRRQAEPQAPAEPRSPFPRPDGDTQILPTVRPAEPKPLPPVLYRERPADLDRAVYNLMGLLTIAGRDKWSATRIAAEILDGGEPATVVRRVGAREKSEAMKLIARTENVAGTPEAAVEGIREVVRAQDEANENEANKLAGVRITAEIDTSALGRDLGAAWANAHAVNEETATFQPITPDMPDPRVKVTAEIKQVAATASVDPAAVPSPVYVDGTTPPVPPVNEVADPDALKPLPRRRDAINVLPAADTDPYTPLDPTDEDTPVAYGSWIWDEGSGTGAPMWFKLQRRHVEVHEEGGLVAALDYCNGLRVEVREGRQVRVLDPVRARDMLADAESKRAERAA